jgi:hypothetical protein
MPENLNLMLIKHLYKEADAHEQFLVQKELLNSPPLRQEYWFLKDTLLQLQLELEEEPILRAIESNNLTDAYAEEADDEVDIDLSRVLAYSKQTKNQIIKPIAH